MSRPGGEERDEDKAADGDGFLSRWSRRKRAAETEGGEGPDGQGAAPEGAPEVAPEPSAEIAPVPEPMTDEELAALPRIADLAEGSDIRAFLNPRVPAALRNAALRRIWSVTSAIRDHRDPAVDYAWDWNTPGGVPGDGHAPTAERAAEMMRDLFRQDPPEGPETRENRMSPELEGRERAPEPGPDATPDTASDPASDAAEDRHLSDRAEEPAAPPTPPAAARRRHGGAMPG